jgi:hypothetical protein
MCYIGFDFVFELQIKGFSDYVVPNSANQALPPLRSPVRASRAHY